MDLSYLSEDEKVIEIIRAASTGQDKLAKLLNDGIDINTVISSIDDDLFYPTYQHSQATTALTQACFRGNIDTVKVLLDCGADSDIKDNRGTTALHYASLEGHYDIVKLLIEKGATIDVVDYRKRNVLAYALKGGNEEIIQFLMNSGLDLNSAGNLTDHLFHSVHQSNEFVVKLLLDHGVGANSESPCRDSTSALNIASSNGSENIVKLLLDKGADPCANYSEPILLSAVRGENINIVKLFLSLNVEVNNSTEKNCCISPLHYAVGRKNEAIIDLLLDFGADINDKSFCNSPLIHQVSELGYQKIIKKLIDLGVNIHVTNAKKETVLHSAMKSGNEDILKLFLNMGVNVNARDQFGAFGRSAMWYAVEKKNESIIDLLLDFGSDVNDSSFDDSLIHCVSKLGYEKIVRRLLKLGAIIPGGDRYNRETVLIAAVKGGNENIVKIFLELGHHNNIGGSNVYGVNALHFAAMQGNVRIIELLLDHGANVNHKSCSGETALYFATENNHNAAVELLSQKGANFNERYDVMFHGKIYREKNLLHIAAENGNVNLAKLFLDLGIDIDSVDYNKKTAVNYAVQNGHTQMFELLLGKGANIKGKEEELLYEACNYRELVKLLLERGMVDVNARYKGYSIFYNSLKFNNQEVVQLFLDYRVNFEVTDNSNGNALHRAVFERDPSTIDEDDDYSECDNNLDIIVEQLLDCGIDVNAKDSINRTPLQSAICSTNYQNVFLLLSYNSDINVKNGIMGCCRSKYHRMIIQYIVKLMSENSFVSETNLNFINNTEFTFTRADKNYAQSCEKEIDELKNTVIEDTAITFYDVLVSKSLNQLSLYARNKNIVQMFKIRKHTEMFPIYEHFLGHQLKKGIWRNLLEAKLQGFFRAVANAEGNEELPTLVNACVHKIFSYLKNSDLMALIHVSNIKLDIGIYSVKF